MERWALSTARRYGLGADAVETIIELDRDGAEDRTVFLARVYRLGVEGTVENFVAAYDVEWPKMFCFEPESIHVVSSLKAAGFTVVAVSNGPFVRQRRKLQAAGLAPVLDGLVTADLAGARKPDPLILRLAAKLANLPLEGWIIGDDPVIDVAAGQAVGLQTVWVSHGRVWSAGPKPDFIVNTLTEALGPILHGGVKARREKGDSSI